MFYTLYHIFKRESIHGRGTIQGRGMIKGRHLALYQIFKTTVVYLPLVMIILTEDEVEVLDQYNPNRSIYNILTE
jgi:hypothetical protein